MTSLTHDAACLYSAGNNGTKDETCEHTLALQTLVPAALSDGYTLHAPLEH